MLVWAALIRIVLRLWRAPTRQKLLLPRFGSYFCFIFQAKLWFFCPSMRVSSVGVLPPFRRECGSKLAFSSLLWYSDVMNSNEQHISWAESIDTCRGGWLRAARTGVRSGGSSWASGGGSHSCMEPYGSSLCHLQWHPILLLPIKKRCGTQFTFVSLFLGKKHLATF